MISLQSNSLAIRKSMYSDPVCSAENYSVSEHHGYKETKCLWIDGDNMVTNNADIPLDETMRFAIKLAMYFDRNNKIDSLLKNFA